MRLFPLSAVRLTGGPLGEAQQVALRYLLALDPDRLLAPYLREAGLPSAAQSYGNWEESGLDGHTGGHYLSALAIMYAATGEPAIRERLDSFVAVLHRCQREIGTGFVGGIPESDRLWAEIGRGHVVADSFGLNGHWVPLYNLHKLFAGLIDAWRYAGSEPAQTTVLALADWWLNLCEALTDEQFQLMLDTEFGGMNEAFVDLAEMSGDLRYSAMARRFVQPSLLGPLESGRDELDGLHANTQIAKVVGYQRLAEVDADEELARASRFFWATVTGHRTVSIGGNSVREHFNAADDFAASMINDREGPETCNTYNMLKLSRMLFLADRLPQYLDYYERATLNHVLSAQHPRRGGFVYFTPMRPGHYRVYSAAQSCFWCCVGTGLESQGKYGELIYGHVRGSDLYVNLFFPSTLDWSSRGLRLRQQTAFPYGDRSDLIIEAAPHVAIAVHVRLPSWAGSDARVELNGEVIDSERSSTDGYVTIRRRWVAGDIVSVHLPMPLRAERLPADSDWVSFLAGPVVLAARHHRGPDSVADGSRMGHVAHGPLAPLGDIPIVVATDDGLASALTATHEALTFRLSAVQSPTGEQPVLEPFFAIHDDCYTIYWPVATDGDLGQRRSRLHVTDRAAAADGLVVDRVEVGEQQPETDHCYDGRATASGTVGDRRWRSSRDWFSYELSDPQSEACTLALTYRGVGDERRFRLVVDDVDVAEVSLSPETLDTAHTIKFDLPEALRADPAIVTRKVRLQASVGFQTADVYRLQLLRRG